MSLKVLKARKYSGFYAKPHVTSKKHIALSVLCGVFFFFFFFFFFCDGYNASVIYFQFNRKYNASIYNFVYIPTLLNLITGNLVFQMSAYSYCFCCFSLKPKSLVYWTLDIGTSGALYF